MNDDDPSADQDVVLRVRVARLRQRLIGRALGAVPALSRAGRHMHRHFGARAGYHAQGEKNAANCFHCLNCFATGPEGTIHKSPAQSARSLKESAKEAGETPRFPIP